MAYSIKNKLDFVNGAGNALSHILGRHLLSDDKLKERLNYHENVTTFYNTNMNELFNLVENSVLDTWEELQDWLSDTKDWDDFEIYNYIPDNIKGYGYFRKTGERYDCDEYKIILKKDRKSAGDAFIIASCFPINQKYLEN